MAARDEDVVFTREPPLPTIQERLRHITPSQELMDFYRNKIAQCDAEHADLLDRLERNKNALSDEVRH